MERDARYTPAALKAAQALLYLGRTGEALALAQTVLAREPQNGEAFNVVVATRSRP